MQRARRALLESAGGSSRWGYRRRGTPSVEPTALASLGLSASGSEASRMKDAATLDAAGGWLSNIQRADGSLPVAENSATPGWATPYALLLWNASGGYEPQRARARAWLLRIEGRTLPRTDALHAEIGHDSTITGWPWVADTHSWLEPTALAILALTREGLSGHPRVAQGIELLLDRSLKGGGWNYGNKAVFGRDLRPQPGPTGLALLALAARGQHPHEADRALGYLRETLPRIRAGISVGSGTLGLRAYDACPGAAETWLAESYRQSARRPDTVQSIALLLLAARQEGLALLLGDAAAGAAKLRRSDAPAIPPAEHSR
jgi:hypothetical protein